MALQNYDFFSTMDEEGTTRGYKAGRALGKALGSIFGKKDSGSGKAEEKESAEINPVNTAPVPSSADAWHAPMAWDKKESAISGELGNIGKTLGGAFPDLDAKKGKLGWLPDWLEGKQGLLPDYFQGKQGMWPDYFPSIEWDAPPKLSGKLAEGMESPFFSNLANKAYNFLGRQDVDEAQYPEEIPMEDYLNKYGTSKEDEQNMLLREALHNALYQGTSQDPQFRDETFNLEDYLGG